MNGNPVIDKYFEKNAKEATKNGLKVGAYYYSKATSLAKADEEAKAVLKWIKGHKITYPVFFDYECDEISEISSLSNTQRTNITLRFLEIIKNAGYKTGYYGTHSWVDMTAITKKGHDFWLAIYPNDDTTGTYWGNPIDGNHGSNRKYSIWQCTQYGHINGILSNVDINVGYKDY